MMLNAEFPDHKGCATSRPEISAPSASRKFAMYGDGALVSASLLAVSVRFHSESARQSDSRMQQQLSQLQVPLAALTARGSTEASLCSFQTNSTPRSFGSHRGSERRILDEDDEDIHVRC